MGNHPLSSGIIGLLVVIVIFLLIREVVCWYWKINRMVELLESIDNRLRENGTRNGN
ncbi:MAG TPA: hypothetical protein VMT61_11200 [Candidatus Binataceae bacterium]|nr:hypothetical protein [Candidatus Binataceae bacterium]